MTAQIIPISQRSIPLTTIDDLQLVPDAAADLDALMGDTGLTQDEVIDRALHLYAEMRRKGNATDGTVIEKTLRRGNRTAYVQRVRFRESAPSREAVHARREGIQLRLINVAVTSDAHVALRWLMNDLGCNRTDVINRALQFYAEVHRTLTAPEGKYRPAAPWPVVVREP
jgi:hypothetical protein